MIDKYIKLQKYCERLFTDHNISLYSKDRFKIIEQVALYIDALIFNIVSIICLITIINNSSKISQKTLEVGKKYIESKCMFNYAKVSGETTTSAMSGGSRLGSATFLGAIEPMYNANIPMNDILTVDFNNYIRPQIGGKQDNKLSKLINTYINSILSYHDIKASNEIKKQIYDIIEFHVMCLINNLKRYKGMIKLATLNKIVKNNKILHPLN